MTLYQVAPPSLITDTARALTATGAYEPDEDGTTKCNLYLDALAQKAFDYPSFHGLSANAIVDFFRTGADDWKPVYETASGVSLSEGFGVARDEATQGYLVVIGLKVQGTHGHVAVVLPAELSHAEKWADAGLPASVPMIAQAGGSVFPPPDKNLGWGISPTSFNAGDFVIYVRRP